MKKLHCYANDYAKVKNALESWGVTFTEKNGFFKLDPIAAQAVAEKLYVEKLLFTIIS